MLIYTDDGIFCAPTQGDIDEVMKILQSPVSKRGRAYREFVMTDEGDLSDYLGVKVEYLENGCIKLS